MPVSFRSIQFVFGNAQNLSIGQGLVNIFINYFTRYRNDSVVAPSALDDQVLQSDAEIVRASVGKRETKKPPHD